MGGFRRSVWQYTAILGLLSILLGACSGGVQTGGGTKPSSGPGGPVTIRLQGDWDTLDPHQTRNSYGYQMAFSLYDRLVDLDKDSKVVPALAESWEAKADEITFKIRKGVTCADGTALTSTAVKDSLVRMGAPETKAPYIVRTIGNTGYTVTADDTAGTVTVKTKAPFSDMLVGMAMPWASVICPAGLKKPEALTTQAFGSGPFVLAKSVRGDSYELTPRTGYTWGANGASTSAAGFPTKLTYRVVANETTAANLLLGKEVDISIVSGQDLNRVAADKALFRNDGVGFGATYLLFNQNAGRATTDLNVRQALAMAIDQKAFNQASTFGTGALVTSYISNTVDCFEPATKGLMPGFDTAAAQKALEAAGYKNEGGKWMKAGKALTVRIVGWDAHNAGPEYILESLKKIGVDATLKVTDLNSVISELQKGDWELSSFPFGPPMPSPNTITSFVTGKGGSNFGAIDNAEFNAAAKAGLEAAPAERCQHWSKAQQALLKNMDIVPLVAGVNSWFGRDVEFRLFSSYVLNPISLRKKV